MADITYGVNVEYTSTGSLNLPNWGAMTGSASQLSQMRSMHAAAKQMQTAYANVWKEAGKLGGIGIDALSGIGDRVISGLTAAGVIAGTALAAGIGLALHEGLKFDEYRENAINSLASIDSMIGNMSFDEGHRAAEGTFERLRLSAKKLPGELKDSMNFMQSIASVTQSVHPRDRVENMSSQGVAAAMALGVSQPVAARELSKMISGHATGNMPFFVKLGLGDAKAFNKLSESVRFEKIEEKFNRLGAPGGAIDAYSHSMVGLKTAMVDTLRNIVGIMAAPLFAAVKNQLENALAWFGKNEHQINAFALKLGEKLRYAFEYGRYVLLKYGPIAISFGERLYEGVKKAVDYLLPHLGTLAKIGLGVAGLGVAAKAAKVASPLAGAVSNLGAAGLKALGVSPSAALGAAMPVAIAGAEILAIVALQTAAAMHVLGDETSYFHDGAVKSFESAKKNMSKIAADMDGVWSAASPAVSGVLNAYGRFVTFMVDIWSTAIAAMMNSTKALLVALHLMDKDKGPPKKPRFVGQDLLRTIREGEQEPPKVVNHSTTIHKVEIHVTSNQDPSRIAREVHGMLKSDMYFPKSAPTPSQRFSRQ